MIHEFSSWAGKVLMATLVLVAPLWPTAWESSGQMAAGLRKHQPSVGTSIRGPRSGYITESTNTNASTEISSLLDEVPKHRHSTGVNQWKRRNPQKLIQRKNNIDACPECGHVKQKHVLCGYCYENVCKETAESRRQIGKREGGL
ncbi:39S ribosomal protein L32, mitochondrial-like [Molossus molossus]|uniref:39S ribosomal protein L32, mitochondrial-like n=1 Tax=Molossus molossus TaxID=27622 RepID=UPI001747403D|nr:39S ribosomal protein L32, mitochondrial-like [Molossus molossus]